MPSKNDLSALKSATQKPVILPSDNTPHILETKPKVKASARNRVGGRPAKPKAEKRSYKVVLSLTEAEGEKLSGKAGLAGDATYLYAKLKELNIL